MYYINYKNPEGCQKRCASALLKILCKIIVDPTQLDAWDSLFAFAPTVLDKPTRRGLNRNLANEVLKNLISCNDVPSAKTIPACQQHHLSCAKYDAILMAAITSKVKAENFRASVRLLCSKRRWHITAMTCSKHSRSNTHTLLKIADQWLNLKKTCTFHLFRCHQKTLSRPSGCFRPVFR